MPPISVTCSHSLSLSDDTSDMLVFVGVAEADERKPDDDVSSSLETRDDVSGVDRMKSSSSS